MDAIPWWGWALIVAGALVAVYYAIVLVFFGKFFKKVTNEIDGVTRRDPWGGKDPFDDPFFKRGR